MVYKPDIIGKRVVLVSTTDPYTHLKPGDKGTVESIDFIGTVFIRWDNGSGLGMIPNEDHFEVLD